MTTYETSHSVSTIMQHFAEFYRAHEGKLLPAIGTDSHLNIDGRFGTPRAVGIAGQHLLVLQKLDPTYVGFALFRTGDHRKGTEHPYFGHIPAEYRSQLPAGDWTL